MVPVSMGPRVEERVVMVRETEVCVIGLVMELTVKPVLVPALRLEAKALLTVKVLLLLSQAQERLELRSESVLEQLRESDCTMSVCWLLEASGFILGNTTWMNPPASTALLGVKDT